MPIDPNFPPPAPQTMAAPIPSRRYARNGLYPDAAEQAALIASLNSARRWRPKEVFRSVGNMQAIPQSTGSTRNRWRFAFHSSPQLRYLRAVLTMAQCGKDSPPYNVDAYGELIIKDVATNTTQATLDMHYGATVNVTVDAPSLMASQSFTISGVPVDTDLYGTFTDVNKGRLVAATIYEQPLESSLANGYVDLRSGVGAPILNTQRSDFATHAKELWKRGASQLGNWTTDVDGDAVTAAASTTFLNLIDGTSTSVSSATPGWYLDTRYHYSAGSVASGTPFVPCVLAVYGNRQVGSTAGQQGVIVKDSGGSTILTCSGLGTTPGWVLSTNQNLTAVQGKFDVGAYNNVGSGGTVTIYAVSLFEYIA